MPTSKEMKQLAAAVARGSRRTPTPGPGDAMPPEYWESVLSDSLANAGPAPPSSTVRVLRLSEIKQHVLRVGCRRCGRTVEIQKANAVRLYGPTAVWKDVGQRLLDNTCQQRTDSHEEDGCWPSYE